MNIVEKTIESQFNTTVTVLKNITESIQNLYKLTDSDAHKIAFLLTQIKLGYSLIIYEEDLTNPLEDILPNILDSQICTIFYNPQEDTNALKDIKFTVIIEHLKLFEYDRPSKKTVREVGFGEFIQICLEYCPKRLLGLSLEFDWETLK